MDIVKRAWPLVLEGSAVSESHINKQNSIGLEELLAARTAGTV